MLRFDGLMGNMGFGHSFQTLSFGFGWFFILFILMFLLIFGAVIFTVIRNIAHWNKNNHAPRLSVTAIVIGKRASYRDGHSSSDNMSRGYTSYYVTFEVESGDRIELLVPDQEYGMLVEKDRGTLEFQGTRYLGFQRFR